MKRRDGTLDQWNDSLDRLEELTKQFQRELGKLQQVAQRDASGEMEAAVALAAPPEHDDDDGSTDASREG